MTVADSAAISPAAVDLPEEDSIYRWRVWPAARQKGKAFVAILVVAALGACAGWLMYSIGWGIFAFVLLVLSLRRFFFPSDYELNAAGATVRCITNKGIPWDRVRRFPHDEHGGLLCVRAQPSRMDAWHGVPILFNNNAAEVIARIERYRDLAKSRKSADNEPADSEVESG